MYPLLLLFIRGQRPVCWLAARNKRNETQKRAKHFFQSKNHGMHKTFQKTEKHGLQKPHARHSFRTGAVATPAFLLALEVEVGKAPCPRRSRCSMRRWSHSSPTTVCCASAMLSQRGGSCHLLDRCCVVVG